VNNVPHRHITTCVLAALLPLGFSSITVPANAQADREVLQKMIAYERDSSDVVDNLEYLSDMIGPRLTGSTKLKMANDWTAEKMRGYGLDNVHLEAYTIPEGWERGSVEARITSPTNLPISAAQMAWTGPTHGKVTGQIVVFAPQTEADFAAFEGKLKNAIILPSATAGPNPSPTGMMAWPGAPTLPPIPAFAGAGKEPVKAAQSAPSTPGPPGAADLQKLLAFRKKLNEFMIKEGVLAVLRDSGKPHQLLNMTGSWNQASPIPTLFVTHEHIALLQRLLKRNQPVILELNVKSRFVKGPITVFNTVGEIKGSEKPNEVVLLGGHLDSWDLGTGSTDNGTGSMAALEAAKLIKSSGVAPKRTIRFIMFTGEEEGLMGSKAYVAAHKAEMDNFDVVYVHDTGTGRVKGLWLQNRAEDKPMIDTQFALLKDLGLLTDEPNILPNKMNGTDHASFDDAGVPAFAFNQDGAEYGLTHHSQSDTFDKVRPDDLKQGACVLAVLGLNAAQMPERFVRGGTVTTR